MRTLKCADSVASPAQLQHIQYKQYDSFKLSKAYEDVLMGKCSLRRAALKYGVPLSTLSNCITGKVQFGKKSGPPQYLTESEELELKNFVMKIAVLGFGYGWKELFSWYKSF